MHHPDHKTQLESMGSLAATTLTAFAFAFAVLVTAATSGSVAWIVGFAVAGPAVTAVIGCWEWRATAELHVNTYRWESEGRWRRISSRTATPEEVSTYAARSTRDGWAAAFVEAKASALAATLLTLAGFLAVLAALVAGAAAWWVPAWWPTALTLGVLALGVTALVVGAVTVRAHEVNSRVPA